MRLVYRLIELLDRKKKAPLFPTPAVLFQYGTPVATHPRRLFVTAPLAVMSLKLSENTVSPVHAGGFGSGGVKVPSVT